MKLASVRQFPRHVDDDHSPIPPARGDVGRKRQHQRPPRGQEGGREHSRGVSGRHGPHRHRPESAGQGCPRKRFCPPPLNADATEIKAADDLAKEVCPPTRGVDEDHFPVRSRQLQDEPRHARPAPDIEKGRRRLREHREKHEGLDHEMPRAGGPGTIGRQAPDPFPALQLVQVCIDLAREAPGKRETKRDCSLLKESR